MFSIFQPDLVITPDSKKMDEEDNVPDKPQTEDIDPLNCKGDNSKPDSNMDADIEFIQKESNKSSETENKDLAENRITVIKDDKSLYCMTSLNSALFLDVVEFNCDLGLKNILSSSPGQRPCELLPSVNFSHFNLLL